MLLELRVRDLGVIDDLVLRLGPGMTALTGETGAGKTLLVEAIELLVGGRSDPALVRAGAETALVEGRFVLDGEEVVLSREVPAEGRSRAYVDGRMAAAAALAEAGARLVDLHGQHAHQSLLRTDAQRAALDRAAGVDSSEVDRITGELRALDDRLKELGGDEQALAREVDLLTFQLAEIDAAAVEGPDADLSLEAEEEVLSSATALRETAVEARELLASDDGARDRISAASALLARHGALGDLAERLVAVAAEVDDIAAELRTREERFEDDPERLALVQERRRMLGELKRKYGPQLSDVLEFARSARSRLSDLERCEERRVEVEAAKVRLGDELRRAEQALGDARRGVAPRLGKEIETRLRTLALPRARLEVHVPAEGRGDGVEFRFGANVGEPALPLGKVASGGELARAMLATRLVLTDTFPTLVFDEVDAGIGGEAALSVGRALSELGARHQVLVVTHLAQVAAFASHQVAVEKTEEGGRTRTTARAVAGTDRVTELSRMLSGQPASEVARRHAAELLEVAAG